MTVDSRAGWITRLLASSTLQKRAAKLRVVNRDDHELRLRYKVAFDTYQALVSQINDTYNKGGVPTVGELAAEAEALANLATARRELQAALKTTLPWES